MGTASTNIAASRCGRNSIGLEIDPHYFDNARKRLETQTRDLFETAKVSVS
jgi:modification methylase